MKDLAFREALNEYIEDEGIEEDVLLLEDHTFDKSVIGISVDGRIIYSLEKMVEEFCEDEECDELEAFEWLDYNTMRALPYMGSRRPIIMVDSKRSIMDKYGYIAQLSRRDEDEYEEDLEEDEDDFQYGHTR